MWGDEITDILEQGYMNIMPDDFDKELRGFRKRALKAIVSYIDPQYPKGYDTDIITLEDISYFLQMVARTKIWKDEVIKTNEILIREFANAVSRKNFAGIIDADNYYISNK